MSLEVKEKTKKGRKRVPRELIYEMRYGSPIYYRDYDKVLSGEKTLEEVMGSSKLQAFIIALIIRYLSSKLDRNKYLILTNEAGFQWAPRTWRNLDIAIFNKNKLLKEGINDKYAKTPPEVVIEVDSKADLRKYGDFMNYSREKTQDLLNAGVKKVIWYTTFDKKVMVAEKGKRWFITDWNDTIDIIDDIKLNLDELLKAEGIKE
ncbi:Uma2 family endonuclease [Persephonella sp.]|uniref:Uma2 family endonuclease n=1 Tax=Persephonella sp. TaxID=2060922 RepID=UPI0025F19246|nr:Uma2 family endonuclease [Persephonella sp.]